LKQTRESITHQHPVEKFDYTHYQYHVHQSSNAIKSG
jgi:hypothetical protein